MFQNFHRPTKIKFAMELKKRRSVSPDLRNPKRRATPLEDSPLARLFNDVGIKTLAREIKHSRKLFEYGQTFLFSLQGIKNDSPEECANDIYDKAYQLWEFDQRLMSACTYAIDQEHSFSDTLLAYASHDAPEQRMASMMKDPWLDYILGLKQSRPIIRGFLSILFAYWNMKDLLDEYQVSDYGRTTVSPYVSPINVNRDSVTYEIDHVQDFRNLREVLESKFSSDPELMASLFEQIKNYQVHGYLARLWSTYGKRARVEVILYSEGSSPLSLCDGTFVFELVEEDNTNDVVMK